AGERMFRPRGERARSRCVVRPRALAAKGRPTPAARGTGGLPDQQAPVGAVRPGRGRGRGGPAGARGQREAYQVRWPGGGIEFHPSHGDWVRLLRRSGFVVGAMHEIFAPPGGADHPFYEIVSAEWATKWPEELWVAIRP